MILGRLLGIILLILTLIIAGAEGLRILQGVNEQWITVAQTINFAFVIGTSDQSVTSESGMLDVPAILVFSVMALVIFLIARRKKRWK